METQIYCVVVLCLDNFSYDGVRPRQSVPPNLPLSRELYLAAENCNLNPL